MASQLNLTTSVTTQAIIPSNEPQTLPISGDASSSHTRQSSSHSQLRSSSSEIELSQLSSNTPARNPASAQASQPISRDDVAIPSDPPQSISPAPSVEVSTMPPSSTHVISISAKACNQWLQSTLGIVTLVLGLVSILVYNVRSYRLAIWTARNDEIQACTGMIQARPEQPVNSNCERLLSTGPQDPPYSLIKRGLQNFLMNKSATFVHGKPTLDGSAVGDETQTSVLLALALILLAVFVADIGIAVLRGYSRTGVPFSSPVRLEMSDTWKQEEIGIPLITTGVEYVFQESRKRKGRLREDDEKFREKEQTDFTSTPASTDSEDELGVAHWEKRSESETESEDDEWSRQHQLYPMKTTIFEGVRETERGELTNSNNEIRPIPFKNRSKTFPPLSMGGTSQADIEHKPRHPDPMYYAPQAAIPNDKSEVAGGRASLVQERKRQEEEERVMKEQEQLLAEDWRWEEERVMKEQERLLAEDWRWDEERVMKEQERLLAEDWRWEEEWSSLEYIRVKEKTRGARDRGNGRLPAYTSEFPLARHQRHSYKRNRNIVGKAVAKIPQSRPHDPSTSKRTPSDNSAS